MNMIANINLFKVIHPEMAKRKGSLMLMVMELRIMFIRHNGNLTNSETQQFME